MGGVGRVVRRAGRGGGVGVGRAASWGAIPAPCVNSLRPTIKNGLKLLECSHCLEPPAAGAGVLNQVFGVSEHAREREGAFFYFPPRLSVVLC